MISSRFGICALCSLDFLFNINLFCVRTRSCGANDTSTNKITADQAFQLCKKKRLKTFKTCLAWLCACACAHYSHVYVCACVCIVCVCIWIQVLFASITVLHCHVSSSLQVCRFDNSAYWHVLRFGGSFHIAACAANSSAILSDIGNGYMEAIAATLPISLT